MTNLFKTPKAPVINIPPPAPAAPPPKPVRITPSYAAQKGVQSDLDRRRNKARRAISNRESALDLGGGSSKLG